VNWDRQGRVQDWVAGAGFLAEFPGQTELSAGWDESFELYQGLRFRKHSMGASFKSEWLPWLALQGDYGRAKRINYYPPTGIAPFSAQGQDVKAGFTLRPTPRFRLSESYLYSRLATPEGSHIFTNHILRSKLHFQFTRPLSVRAIVDYQAVLPDTGLVAVERSKRFGADILLTYLVNPGTALYVGYTDLYENLALAGVPPSLVRTTHPNQSTGRQFLVKLSYLFRY